jgi:hypothetical protein
MVPKQWVKELMLQLVLGTARRCFERMPQLWSEALCCHTCQTVWRRDALRKPDISARYLVWAIEPGATREAEARVVADRSRLAAIPWADARAGPRGP